MALQVTNLGKSYPIRSGQLQILDGITFAMETGESMAIMGPSGSGKSTLLQIIGTLDQPTSGEVVLDGQNPFLLTEKSLAHFRNQSIGFIFQDHHLLPQFSTLENVVIPTLVNPTLDRAATEVKAKALLERVGLKDRLDHRPAELSGGERQRVAIARALVHKPKLVLADEPTGNLDRKTAQTVLEILLELQRQEHTTLIVVTHSLELAKRFPKSMEMIDGKLSLMA